MRIVFFGNNRLGARILSWLKMQGEDIVGLVLHAEEKRTFGDEIRAAAGLGNECIFDASRLNDDGVVDGMRRLGGTLGLSILFGYVFKPPLIGVFPRGIVNLHPSVLPFNRGPYPNVWSIVEKTPAGATLHYIDEDIDTGDIIAQVRSPALPWDTGETLYRRLEEDSFRLFTDEWARLRAGTSSRIPQPSNVGSSHNRKDVERIDRIDLDRPYRAGDLIDVLRARTFPPHRGAYFEHEGRRVYMRLSFELENET